MDTMTIEVTWGERLSVELGRYEDRTGVKITPLFTAVGRAADVRPNTIGNLRKATTTPKGKQARYAWLLFTVMGLDPEDFGIVADWPDAFDRQRQLRAARTALGGFKAGRDSADGTSDLRSSQPTWNASRAA